MENNTLDTLSIDKLQAMYKTNNYTNPPNIELLKEVLNILKTLPKFHAYLEEKDFDYYELPYMVFGEIISFLKYCHDSKDFLEIEKVLIYLESISRSESIDIKDLLMVGALEVFDIHKEIISEIISFMPENLKGIFLRYFSDYLK